MFALICDYRSKTILIFGWWWTNERVRIVRMGEEINWIEMQQNKQKNWSKHIDCILDAFALLFDSNSVCLFVNCKQFSGFVNNTKFSLWKDNWQVIESSTIIVCEYIRRVRERERERERIWWRRVGVDGLVLCREILEIEIFYARWCSFIMKIHTHENKQTMRMKSTSQHQPRKWW
jgi:hypothetical protein